MRRMVDRCFLVLFNALTLAIMAACSSSGPSDTTSPVGNIQQESQSSATKKEFKPHVQQEPVAAASPAPVDDLKVLLIDAVANGKTATVKGILDKGADANAVHAELDMSVLTMAVLSGHDSIAEMLLENGANPNRKDRFGFPEALRAAITTHNAPIVRTLLSRGTTVNNDVLSWAEAHSDTEILSILKNSGWQSPTLQAGVWEGTIETPHKRIPIIVTFARRNEQWSGSIDVPHLSTAPFPLEAMKIQGAFVGFSVDWTRRNQVTQWNPPMLPLQGFRGTLSKDGKSMSGSLIDLALIETLDRVSFEMRFNGTETVPVRTDSMSEASAAAVAVLLGLQIHLWLESSVAEQSVDIAAPERQLRNPAGVPSPKCGTRT